MYRSGFERTLVSQLNSAKVKFRYEPFKLPYIISHEYTPDFELPNGILIEAKGKLDAETKRKMVAVKKYHPKLDIRFVFMRASNPIQKGSKTTYGDWATKNGFLWANGRIPQEWLDEPGS